jgi:flagellar assembly protein FliH
LSDAAVTLRRTSIVREAAAPVVTLAYPELPSDDGAWQQDAPAGPWHDGYADGYAAGRQDALRAANDGLARIDELTEALSRAITDVHVRQAGAVEVTGTELADAAVILAEALLGRALPDGGEIAVGVARSLALVPPDVTATVRVNPEDADFVPADLLQAGINVVADPAVAPGGCFVEIGDTVIDGGLAAAVARARAALVDGDSAW